MHLAGSRGGLRAPGTDQQLHREKLGEHEMLTRGVALYGRRREMDFVQGVLTRSEIRVLRQQRGHRRRIEILERVENHRAENTLRKSLGGRINRRDPAKVNRDFVVILDHLELRMLHAKPFSAQTRFSENNQALPGRNHLLHVMQVEPTQDQRLAEGVRIRFLQRGFENLLPATETNEPCSCDLSAKKNRRVAFFAGEIDKVRPVFVTTRIMGQEIFDGFDFEPAERRQLGPRNPLQFAEGLRILDHSIGPAARRASTWICSRVSPSYSSAFTRNAMSQGGFGSGADAPSKKIARRK